MTFPTGKPGARKQPPGGTHGRNAHQTYPPPDAAKPVGSIDADEWVCRLVPVEKGKE